MEEDSEEEFEKIVQDSKGLTKCLLSFVLNHGSILWWTYLAINVAWLGAMLTATFARARRVGEEWFWIAFATKTFVLTIIQFISGFGVRNWNWKVGYTRKCVHIGFFLLPELLDVSMPLPEQDSWLWAMWNLLLISIMLLLITRPIRNRSLFIQVLYASIDRPEDNGLTMLYTFTQVPLTVITIAGFSLLFRYVFERQAWILAPVIAVTFGDGLAEPVAVLWKEKEICGGTHTYETTALCAGSRTFTRSFEGSVCVALFSAVGVLCVFSEQTTIELIVNLTIMPITMTLLEAVAPHSLDNPFLLTWGCAVMIAAHALSNPF